MQLTQPHVPRLFHRRHGALIIAPSTAVYVANATSPTNASTTVYEVDTFALSFARVGHDC